MRLTVAPAPASAAPEGPDARHPPAAEGLDLAEVARAHAAEGQHGQAGGSRELAEGLEAQGRPRVVGLGARGAHGAQEREVGPGGAGAGELGSVVAGHGEEARRRPVSPGAGIQTGRQVQPEAVRAGQREVGLPVSLDAEEDPEVREGPALHELLDDRGHRLGGLHQPQEQPVHAALPQARDLVEPGPGGRGRDGEEAGRGGHPLALSERARPNPAPAGYQGCATTRALPSPSPLSGVAMRPLLLTSLLALLSCKPDEGSGTGPSPDDTAGGGGDDTGGEDRDPYDVAVGPYQATVRWTAYGVPHIVAEDMGSLGFGMGYAHARDHFCTVMDQVILVSSERSRYLGAGEGDVNVETDIGWLAIGVRAEAERAWFDIPEDMAAGIVGYAAGLNRYVEEVGVDGLPQYCAGADWVRELDHIDLYSYYLALSLNASGAVWVDEVGQAEPPSPEGVQIAPPGLGELEHLADLPLGSNGWALGRDKTAHGGGLLLSNTHFPAEGERAWHESHLTIPGELDVYGASLVGVPIINLGFNRHVAWTHTVSTNPRFIVRKYELDPEDPTRYLYDGEYEAMVPTEHTIEVLQEDGSLGSFTKTTWRTRHGLVFNAPAVGWNTSAAVAYEDVNADNNELIQVWLGMNRARSLADFKAAHYEHPGIPWVHTMAVDTEGNAFYIDSARTPNWSEEAEARWAELYEEDFVVSLFAGYGVYVADGGDPVFERQTDEEGPGGEAAPEGVVAPWNAPQLERTDFVFNANNNHWLTHPDELLEGYPLLYGSTGTGRSLRTRMNAVYLTEAGADGPAGEDGLWTREEVEAAALGCRVMSAELLQDDLVGFCEETGSVSLPGDGGTETVVDLAEACAVLAAWEGTCRLDDPGAALFREFFGSADFTTVTRAGDVFAVPFDAADPVGTPNTLNLETEEDRARVGQALAEAVLRLDGLGIALDAPMRDVQYLAKEGERLPFPGGSDRDGAIQIATWAGGASRTTFTEMTRAEEVNGLTDLTTEGYAVNYGNSFVLTVAMGEEGPDARALITYSQSMDPASPHYADQTAVYAEERLRPVLFEEADILADPELVELELSHPGG